MQNLHSCISIQGFAIVMPSHFIDQVNPGESCNMLLLSLIKPTATTVHKILETEEECKRMNRMGETDGVKQDANEF